MAFFRIFLFTHIFPTLIISNAGLDTENPVRQIFTLFYRSTSARRSELKFFVRDNFGREREMTVTFDLENTTAKE